MFPAFAWRQRSCRLHSVTQEGRQEGKHMLLRIKERDDKALAEAPRDNDFPGGLAVPNDVFVCQGEAGLALLHIRKGMVYKANRTGSRIWRRVVLDGNLSAL